MNGTRMRSRTSNLLIRSQVLYPIELCARADSIRKRGGGQASLFQWDGPVEGPVVIKIANCECFLAKLTGNIRWEVRRDEAQ